jgi:hypothetical protein
VDFTPIAAGMPVLVPILNCIVTQFPSDPKNFDDVALKQFKASITDFSMKIDGIDIKHLQSDLVRTGFFSAGQATPGTISEWLANPDTNDVSDAKSLGYWGVVSLAHGAHTIEFGGSTNTGFSGHVIDHVTVA